MEETIAATAKHFIEMDIFLDSPFEYCILSMLDVEHQCANNAIPTSNQMR